MTELPNGWALTTLESLAEWGSGGTPSRKNSGYFGGNIPWIKTGELGPMFIRCAEEFITEKGLSESSAKVFPKGSVGIAMYGATIGKVSIWGVNAATNQACAVARPFFDITSSKFIYYFLASVKRDLVRAGKGGAQANISQGLIRDWPVALPPLPEQHRIVAKIEALFSELDAGQDSLAQAQAQLKLYRQSLLKAAFEGRLTADWRKASPDKLEPPETLLARIRSEREARYKQALDEWQTALTEWRDGGEVGRKPAKPKRPADLTVSPEVNVELPSGWLSVTVEGLLAEPLSNGRSVKDRAGGFPVLRLSAFRYGRLDLSEWKPGAWTVEEAGPWVVQEGDFFAARGNGSKHLVGIGALAIGVSEQVAYPDTMIRFCLDRSAVAPDYFLFVWNSRIMRDQIEGAARTTAGIYKINQPHICGFIFPLPPRDEQEEILNKLSPTLSQIEYLETEITTALAKLSALRQSILKKAFSGQLVPQDPADKPASALLSRLRDAAPKEKPRRKVRA